MPEKKTSIDKLIESLQERSKELNCLFQVEEILSNFEDPLSESLERLIHAIPPGYQYSNHCVVKITLENKTYTSPNFVETRWVQSADVVIQEMVVGTISVYYTKEFPTADHGPFLREEAKLVKTIAERLSHYIQHLKMRRIVEEWGVNGQRTVTSPDGGEWRIILELLRQTDRDLYQNIARKMLNHLCWSGISDAKRLMQSYGSDQAALEEDIEDDEHWNRPYTRRAIGFSANFADAAFKIAGDNLPDDEILGLIRKWIQEDKLSFLVQVVNRNLSLAEVADAIRRYHHLMQDEPLIPSPGKKGVQVSLIRRFLSDQLAYVNIAKNYIRVRDFYHLLQNVIFSAESHGKLGGKSAGLYLAAQILKKKGKTTELLSSVKVPKTWHITSDVLLHFMHYNNFDEVVEQKYKDLHQVRLEYPHIVQTFKNALFPSDILKGLSVALDDFEDRPLIVRSSSLLEDRVGSSFSGKYKSLFLANQGTKQKRLDALVDAIAEVYASTFSPDPIEYRAERGLIDFGEEMGIMIQEVVGTKIGKYYFPAWAGVAVSNNEFRWSPRIKRKDGLLRLVPGLGTRAVDRLADDYPVLVAPGQPGLSVNVSPDEVWRYSPKQVDVINLETNAFETLSIKELFKEAGYQIPGVHDIVSVYKDNHVSQPMGISVDLDRDEIVVTFDGLINRTPFVQQMRTMLNTLEETLGQPVDIEFASDGRDFYLLQCRPQSYSDRCQPAPIPKDIPHNNIIFTAEKYVSNGRVPSITHIVYVDPDKYSQIGDRGRLLDVGRAVSALNKILPKRQFVLMGPGRWGSRGDIKLGVNVTYSDINNTAVLIEVARKKGNYVPDLSFGTHFFQDLVEANIRYLPLYPDDDGMVFNEQFLKGATNLLAEVLPDFAFLSDAVRLIDVAQSADGQVLHVLMNADQDKAIGFLAKPSDDSDVPCFEGESRVQESFEYVQPFVSSDPSVKVSLNNWQWRYRMVERIASEIEADRFGVAGFYVFGSTKNASARAESGIDVIVHFRGTDDQLTKLQTWLEGWSLCLSEMNYIRTGHKSNGLLNVHIVTDADIERKVGFAAKIGAITDAARPLAMKNSSGS